MQGAGYGNIFSAPRVSKRKDQRGDAIIPSKDSWIQSREFWNPRNELFLKSSPDHVRDWMQRVLSYTLLFRVKPPLLFRPALAPVFFLADSKFIHASILRVCSFRDYGVVSSSSKSDFIRGVSLEFERPLFERPFLGNKRAWKSLLL